VERGSKRNTIVGNSFGTLGANTVYDIFDGNPNCDGNLWRVNQFVTANRSCIQ